MDCKPFAVRSAEWETTSANAAAQFMFMMRAGENRSEHGTPGPTIWIEVDDLIRYFDGSFTPTGISRVQLQVLPHLARAFPERVRFCRFGASSRDLELLEYKHIAEQAGGNIASSRTAVQGLLVPFLRLRRYLGRRIARTLQVRKRRADRQTFVAAVKPGDVILSLGASWSHRNFARTIRELKQTHGVRFAILVHDILPISDPQFVSAKGIPTFARWLSDMAGLWDIVMTQSQSSASQLKHYLAAQGRAPSDVVVIRFGAGFPSSARLPGGPTPAERSHVLYVSTIEIRKNHILLFQIWRRLLREKESASVPDLIFVGKYGWQIQELQRALRESRFLNGKIKVIENLSDDGLADLYRRSHFTVFPSFCEGWGLPVAESLYHGRYCIASNATSIPEIGGELLDYHDPSDIDHAYRLIERALSDRAFLAGKERTILEQYAPPDWSDTANDIIAAINRAGPVSLKAE